MKPLTMIAASLACAIAFATQASAGSRAWVSSTGTDSGTCLIAAPCRTFQYAHDHLDPGGEIDVKDSGGFGGLVITKAISVIAPDGVLATVGIPNGGSGISVNAGSGDNVTLRGLTIDGFNIGSTLGVSIYSARSINIDHMTIINNSFGIYYSGFAGSSAIVNCLVTANGIGLYFGFYQGASVLSSNVITGNQTGIKNLSESVYTYGSNLIANNNADLYGSDLIRGSLK